MAKIYASRHVKDVRTLYEDNIRQIGPKARIRDWLKTITEELWEAYRRGDQRIIPELSNYHPELIGASSDTIMSHEMKMSDMESIILEEYGYISWDHASAQGRFDVQFEQAVNTALSGELDRMMDIIIETPELVNKHSKFGHGANLVQYLGANGVEIWRQIVSINTIEMLELLIEQGADPNAANNIYGGSSLRTLIETSQHTFDSGLAEGMLDRLEVYGY